MSVEQENPFTADLNIPDIDIFSSFDCTFPPMSPQVSAEAIFMQKEKKEEEWKKCKKISGGVLWGPCFCDDCERESPKASSSTRLEEINSFLFPSRELVVRKNYFNNDHEEYYGGRDAIIPNMNLFDDHDSDDYDEVLALPKRYKKRRRPKRPREEDLFDDYEYEPETYTLPKKKTRRNKRSMSAGRLKYLEDAQLRSFNIMNLYEKGNRSRSETGYLGVRISTSGRRFRATVNYMGKPRNVGTFDTPEEAAMEYDKKLLELSDWRIDRNRLNYCDQWDLKNRKLTTRPKKRRRISNYDALFD